MAVFLKATKHKIQKTTLNWGTGGHDLCGVVLHGTAVFWRTRYVVHIRNRQQYIRNIIGKRYYPSCMYINYIVSVSGIQWIIITSRWEMYVCNHGLIWMWTDDQENCWWDNIGTILVYIYVCSHIESHLMGNGFGDGSIGFLLSRDSNQMNVNFAWIGKVVITHRIRYPISDESSCVWLMMI